MSDNKEKDKTRKKNQIDLELRIKWAVQLREIREHKFYLSQEAGYDVGMEEATMDWGGGEQCLRFKKTFEYHARTIRKICKHRCKYHCPKHYLPDEDKIVPKEEVDGKRSRPICSLTMQDIHKILEDGQYSKKE